VVRHADLALVQDSPTSRTPGDRVHWLDEVSPPPALPTASGGCASWCRGQSTPVAWDSRRHLPAACHPL